MSEHAIIAVTAVVGLALIEMMALYKGINGKLLIMVVGAIAGIAGASVDRLLSLFTGGG